MICDRNHYSFACVMKIENLWQTKISIYSKISETQLIYDFLGRFFYDIILNSNFPYSIFGILPINLFAI